MAQTVSTGQIIDDVAQRTGLSKAEAKKVVQAMVDALGEQLSNGARIQLTGLGSFDVRDRAAREATNPRTKEKIQVAATKVVGFRPATSLRERVGGDAS
jgi:DNA-binding protein HU-beta